MVRVLARCVHGTEWAAAAELARVVGVDGVLSRRAVAVDVPALSPHLLDLRCSDDVFLHVGDVARVGGAKADVPVLARGVARLPWVAALSAVAALRSHQPATFDCVASIEGRHSAGRYTVEDAVGAALAPVLGLRYLSRTREGVSGDATVRVFVAAGAAVATLRVPPRPLHRRAWKLDTGPGTLHPPLAAVLVALLADGPVHDPFCGDGTLAIEAALAGRTVTAADLDPGRVAHSLANADRAGVTITVTEADAADLAPGPRRTVLTNPPWNRTVGAAGRATLATFLDAVAAAPQLCLLTDVDQQVPDELRRRGVAPTLVVRVRLAGRPAEVTLTGAAPPPDIVAWRDRAAAAGVGMS